MTIIVPNRASIYEYTRQIGITHRLPHKFAPLGLLPVLDKASLLS